MNTILIIGATGRINSYLIPALMAQPNVALRLTSSRPEGVQQLAQHYPRAQVMQADWHDQASLIRAFEGVDRVVMIPPDFVLDETLAVANVHAAYRANPGVKQLVRLIANPDGLTWEQLPEGYRATRAGTALHLQGKALLDNTEMPLTYLNMLAWFTSNLPWFFAQSIHSENRMQLPGLDVPRAWLSEEDMAQAFVKVLTEPVDWHVGQHYRLSQDQRHRLVEIAAMLSQLLGKDIRFENTDESLVASGQQVLADYVNYESQVWQEYGQLEQHHTEALLNRPPQLLLDWLTQNKHLFS